jgi:hypothetical protein
MTNTWIFRLRIDREDAPTLFVADTRSPEAALTKSEQEAHTFNDEACALQLLQNIIRCTSQNGYSQAVKNKIFTHEETRQGLQGRAVIYVEQAYRYTVMEATHGSRVSKAWEKQVRGGVVIPRI